MTALWATDNINRIAVNGLTASLMSHLNRLSSFLWSDLLNRPKGISEMQQTYKLKKKSLLNSHWWKTFVSSSYFTLKWNSFSFYTNTGLSWNLTATDEHIFLRLVSYSSIKCHYLRSWTAVDRWKIAENGDAVDALPSKFGDILIIYNKKTLHFQSVKCQNL